MPSDSSFSHFDAKLMLSSFFAIVIIFGVLTGFGLLQKQIGEPPQLASDNESLIDFSGPNFPKQPGTITGTCTWNTQVNNENCTVINYDNDKYQIDFTTANVSYNGEYVTIVQVEFIYNISNGDEFFLRKNGTNTITMSISPDNVYEDSNTYKIIRPTGDKLAGNDITITFKSGNYSSGSFQYEIEYGQPNNSGLLSGVAQAVTFIGNVIFWAFEYVITLLITILTAVVKISVWIVNIFWYLINGWLALNGLVGNQWFGLILQGITLSLFIGFFNGTVKIIQIIW